MFSSRNIIVCSCLSYHHPLFQPSSVNLLFLQIFQVNIIHRLFISNLLSPFSYTLYAHVFRPDDVGLQNLCEGLSLEETDSTSVHRFEHLVFLSMSWTMCTLPYPCWHANRCYHDVSFAKTTIFLRFMSTFHLSFQEEPIQHQTF